MEALLFLLCCLAMPVENTGPELMKGVMIQDSGAAIDVKVGHLVPSVGDWNNDGKKDLLVGQYDDAKIRLYLNQGTDEAPRFHGFEFLSAGGKEISLESG